MHGKIISKDEADKQFGPVQESITISAKDLLSMISNTGNSVMFNIINGELQVLGDGRKVLHPAGREIKPDIPFHHFSKEIVMQLINGSTNSTALTAVDATLAVEKRQDKLTVTCGASTLEWSAICPPFCL